jgi:hypothetical protein
MCRSLLPLADDISRSSSLRGRETPPAPAQYRPLREIRVVRIPFIVLSRKFRPVWMPITSVWVPQIRSQARRKARTAMHGGRFRTVLHPQSLETTLRRPYTLRMSSLPGRNSVPPGNPGPGHIVLLGNSYRLRGEGLSFGPGTNIVLPGKVYRPPREGIASCRGKLTVLLEKYTAVFPANACLHICKVSRVLYLFMLNVYCVSIGKEGF